MYVYLIKESYCMDPFSIHKIFKTKALAEKYIEDMKTGKCTGCGGTGKVECDDEDDDYEYDPEDWVCFDCNGEGIGYNQDVYHYIVSEYKVED